jgi:hypothetical protein
MAKSHKSNICTEQNSARNLQPFSLSKINSITREGIAAIKKTDFARGASLSNSATSALASILDDVQRGNAVIKGAQLGHELVHGNSQEKQERWAKMQASVNQLCNEHPDWTWKKIQERVASEMNCSSRTITRHCCDPRKNT